ncbi:MAG: hypothetical protein JW894_13865 [Bacteroidales bacterium]|nr:hypothetical protein [Bacteroidales bacterium]
MMLKTFCIWFVLSLMFYSCREDLMFSENIDQNYPVKISYEEETISFYDSEKTDNSGNPVNQVMQEPKIDRKHVFIGINHDGTSLMEISFIKPRNQFRVPSDALPNPDPQLSKIRFENGQIYYLDRSGALVRQEFGKSPLFTGIIKYLKENNNQFSRNHFLNYMTITPTADAENIASAKDDGNFYITETIIGTEHSAPEEMIGKTILNYFDKTTETLAAQTIIDETGNYMYRCQFNFCYDETNPIPEFIKEESFETNENGELSVTTTIRYIENVEITVNL